MPKKEIHETRSPEETRALAAVLLKQIKSGLILLRGNLGSGKTTFVQGLGRALGISEPIQSPTFVLHKIYPSTPELHHYDFYRLTNVDAGFIEEICNMKKSALIAIEWPERMANYAIDPALKVDFSYIDERTRRCTILWP